LVALILLLFSWGLSQRNGASDSDFGAHPDEGAHVVTSLMVRDYLATGLLAGQNPIAFSDDYYRRLPKVALGHYPPGFYLLAGVWMLPAATPGSIIGLMIALSAGLGLVGYWCARQLSCGRSMAALASVAMVAHVEVQRYSAIVMSDVLLATLLLAACLVFARFLDRPTVMHALGFGLLAAAACLTKSTGLVLAMVPPLAILITRRFHLLKNPRLWLAPLPVLLFALPWQLYAVGITKEGLADATIASYLPMAVPFYSTGLLTKLGWVGVGSLIVGPFILRRDQRAVAASTACCLAALAMALLLLICIIPTGLTTRYLLPLVAPSIALFTALAWRFWEQRSSRHVSTALVLTALAAIHLGFTLRMSPKISNGYSEAIQTATEHLVEGQSTLILSDARGEGALISSGAFLLGTEGRTGSSWETRRGTKLLAESDWMGRGYETKFSSAAELESLLTDARIGSIILEEGVPSPPRHLSAVIALTEQIATLRELTPQAAERATGATTLRIFSIDSPSQ